MSELFNVMFSGEISGRADPAAVRANVGKLFNASEAVLDKLFSGQPVAVKKMVDRATAMKVRAMMKQAGAETRMVPVDEQGRPLTAAPTPAPAASVPPVRPVTASAPVAQAAPPVDAPQAAPATESMAERLQRLAGAPPVEAARPSVQPAPAGGDWGVAPAGTRLSPADTGPAPVVPDVSAIVLAPAGSDVLAPDEKPYIPPVQVDISAINLAPPGTEVLKDEERPRVEAVKVDISGMSMAEVGAPLDEIREAKKLVNPDISHLTMAE